MAAKKISKTAKTTKTTSKVVKKKSVAPKRKQQSISDRLQDKNVQAGIVVVLLGFTVFLLLMTYFGSN